MKTFFLDARHAADYNNFIIKKETRFHQDQTLFSSTLTLIFTYTHTLDRISVQLRKGPELIRAFLISQASEAALNPANAHQLDFKVILDPVFGAFGAHARLFPAAKRRLRRYD